MRVYVTGIARGVGLQTGRTMAGQLTNIVIPDWYKGYMSVRRYNDVVLENMDGFRYM